MGRAFLGVFLSLVLIRSIANGQILSNYPQTNDTGTTADVDNLRWKSISFDMPAATTADVGNLTVRLGNYAVAADVPIFEIRDSAGTVPGASILLSFTAPAPGGAAIQDYTFTPAGSLQLQASTSYFIVARGLDAVTSFDWRGSSPSITPTGIATYGGESLFSTNGGTSWAASATINTLRLDVIPEPSMMGLASLALMAGLTRRR